jgi:hypothetical protein
MTIILVLDQSHMDGRCSVAAVLSGSDKSMSDIRDSSNAIRECLPDDQQSSEFFDPVLDDGAYQWTL